MANTFKTKTKAGVTTEATVYTVPNSPSTTAICIGGTIANKTTSGITVSVIVQSDTSDTETNANASIAHNVPLSAGSSLKPFSDNKQVLQATDVLRVSATGSVDVVLNILEIT